MYNDLSQVLALTRRGSDQLQKNALGYVLMGDGIPMTYSGAEQGYAGGKYDVFWNGLSLCLADPLSAGEDPLNREPLWHSGFNTSTELYGFLARLNAARALA